MNDLDKNLDIEDFEPRIYEIGYHVVPTVAEDKIELVVDTIKESIKKMQGTIISEDIPKLVELAYSMDHVVENKKTIFNSAYFGWIKFEGNPKNVIKIKDFLDKNESILRFIIIKTVKESVLPKKSGNKTKQVSSTKKVAKEITDTNTGTDAKNKVKEVVSEEEVDKAIEELVV